MNIKQILRKGSVCSSASVLVRFTSCALAAGAEVRSGASAGWVCPSICMVFASFLFGFQLGAKQSAELTGTNSSALNPEKGAR